jgi:predicted transcriptional regulator
VSRLSAELRGDVLRGQAGRQAAIAVGLGLRAAVVQRVLRRLLEIGILDVARQRYHRRKHQRPEHSPPPSRADIRAVARA